MDLYVHNTCIEFNTNIVRNGKLIPGYMAQLDEYLESLLKAGTGVRNSILTDGVRVFRSWPRQETEVISLLRFRGRRVGH